MAMIAFAPPCTPAIAPRMLFTRQCNPIRVHKSRCRVPNLSVSPQSLSPSSSAQESSTPVSSRGCDSNIPSGPPVRSAALLPATVLLCTGVALSRPSFFNWFLPSFTAPCLAAIMLCMGLTLQPSDFSRVASQPHRLLLGACAQYGIMPTLAYILARVFALPPALATGVILVGACPGGAASNIVCLFAGADVAYSVLLTLVSTAFSVAMTPLLVLLLAGTWLPVNAFGLLLSVAQVVILPLAFGGAVQAYAPKFVRRVERFLPVVSVGLVGAICGSVVSRSTGAVGAAAPRLVAALALLHGLGAGLGYLVGVMTRTTRQARRTLALEVCMQNSTLASSLAQAHFADPIVAVPGAVSATLHSVLGSLLAAMWRVVDSVRERRTKR